MVPGVKANLPRRKFFDKIPIMNYTLSSIVSLISHIHSETAEFLREKLSQEGLPSLASSHGNILYQLSIQDGLSMGELSTRINRNKSTTTALTKKLLELDLIQKKETQTDKRQTLIYLSEKGLSYTKKCSDISKKLLECFFKNFLPEEKNTLLKLLNKVSNNFL